MKSVLTAIAAFIIIFSGHATAATVRADDFFYGIRARESGNNYQCPPGRLGEQGPYQFKPVVWRQHTNAHISSARTAYADVVAQKHFDWISRQLTAAGLQPTHWRIAAAWNAGAGAVIRGRIPKASREYADAVVNLMQARASSFAGHRNFKIALSDSAD